MALNPKKPVPAKREISDATFERISRGAIDYKGEAGAEPAVDPDPDPIKPKGVKMGNKRQISLTIDGDMLEEIDALAKRRRMGRAATIVLALGEHLERSQKA